MIFGKTYKEMKELDDKKYQWRKWFAWKPITLNDGRKVWLQFIECRVLKKPLYASYRFYDFWEYRLIENT